MNTFRLVISSPEGNIFDGEAVMISVRGVEGELAVMAGHIPFVTSVVECDCKIELPDDTDLIGHINGGLITVSKDKVTLLSGSLKWNTKQ